MYPLHPTSIPTIFVQATVFHMGCAPVCFPSFLTELDIQCKGGPIVINA